MHGKATHNEGHLNGLKLWGPQMLSLKFWKIPLIEMIHLKFGYIKVYTDREF